MPSPTAAIGATLTGYVPDVDDQIALGYTDIRFYTAASESGSYSLADTIALVSGTLDYSTNVTAAMATDWFYFVPYGSVPGEGVASEPMPVGPPQCTRLQVRQAVGKRLRLLYTGALASVSSSTVGIITDLIDPDASAHKYGNRIARVYSGTAIGQTRRVRSGSTGYAVVTGQLTINRATSPAWLAGDGVELWKPQFDDDPSLIIDDAMNTARLRMWWEDTFYFTTDDNVSEYYGPATLREEYVKAVEYANDSYPASPDWRSVGWYRIVQDGGQPLISALGRGRGWSMFSAGSVVRIIYNRFGDRMDTDTDYWNVPLEWAAAEVALDTVEAFRAPQGSREGLDDYASVYATLQREVMDMRAAWMPSPATRSRVMR